MLDAALIKKLFRALNAELAKKDVVGEVGICGGAVMCLVYHARPATKDIDAIFEPAGDIRKAARRVARTFGLADDWLNDAVKGFFCAQPPREDVFHLSHLRVWAPSADYMLAMKCVSSRLDTFDRDDIGCLIEVLKLATVDEVLDTIVRYYPHERIPARTRFLVEEIMERSGAGLWGRKGKR